MKFNYYLYYFIKCKEIMNKKRVNILFDRRCEIADRGKGKVDVQIRIAPQVVKYITIDTVTLKKWEKRLKSGYWDNLVRYYQNILYLMEDSNMEMTLDNYNAMIGVNTKRKFNNDFLEFMEERIMNESINESTRKRKLVTLRAIREFGHLKNFSDLTTEKIEKFYLWVKKTRNLSQVTFYTYHKHLHMYCDIAYCSGYIKQNPYSKIHIQRGVSKDRQPLMEDELKAIRNLRLSGVMDRVRDCFIFMAYTGLPYSDFIQFNYYKMVEVHEGIQFINGYRLKNEISFYTPILPPAMKILEKYNYKLPTITNQKMNMYLGAIKEGARINKPVTCHIARYSFATLAISCGVSYEHLARMLGHKDVRTTQAYGRLFNSQLQTSLNNFFSKVK